MYKLLWAAYGLLDRLFERCLPDSWVRAWRGLALRVAHRFFPGRLVVHDVEQLEALARDNHWNPPALPDWVYEELGALEDIAPELHPRGELVSSAQFYSAPWTYDLPGEAYFKLRAQFPAQLDVVLFVPWLKSGGADLGAIRFANALAADFGLRVAVVATEDSESPWRERLLPQVTFVAAGSSLVPLYEQHQVEVVVRLLLQLAPATVHIMNSRVAWDAVKRFGLAIRQQSRVYASLYCDDISERGERVGYARRYLVACHHLLDGVISDNPITPLRWCAESGVSPRLFHVVRFPGPQPVEEMRETVAGNGQSRVLWAGRLDRQKRPDLLARIAAAMPEVQFDVHGTAVVDDVADQGLSRLPNVHLHGAFDGFESLLAGGHAAYLYTSQWDGLPNVLLEAAAAGLPIVASDVGGVGDFLAHEQRVEPFDDVDGYVRRLNALLADPSLASEWVARQRARLQQAHSSEAFLTAVAAIPGYLPVRGGAQACPGQIASGS